MKTILKNIQAALKKIEQAGERRQQLNAEKQTLAKQITTLTAAVAGGDGKSVNALAIAKARAEVLPADQADQADEYHSLLVELHGLESSLYPALAEVWNAESTRMEEVAQNFLGQHLDNTYQIGEITRQIVTNSKKLSHIDRLKMYFSSLGLSSPDEQTILSRAEFALENLKDL